jgi:hypothetical protein
MAKEKREQDKAEKVGREPTEAGSEKQEPRKAKGKGTSVKAGVTKRKAKKNGRRFSEEQYQMLLRCSEKKDMTEWNHWRKENPDQEIYLEGGCLEKFYLAGANLRNAHLDGANLSRANLERGRLQEAYIRGANLRAYLKGAKFWYAHLEETDLWRAHIEDADFYEAHLQGAHFGAAQVDGETLMCGCRVDKGTDFTGVALNNACVEPGLKQLLEYNVRRIGWKKWYNNLPRLDWHRAKPIDERKGPRWKRGVRKGFVQPFWWMSDYGRSTGRIIAWFFGLAFAFAFIYWVWPSCVMVNGVVGDIRGFVHAFYFSVVTMTTLGFGDIAANPGSGGGQVLLMLQVILGYVLLGALVTRFAVLFTAGGPAGRFADEKNYGAVVWEKVKQICGVIKKILAEIRKYLGDVVKRRSTRRKRQKKKWDKRCPAPRTGWLGDFLETGDVIHVQGRGVFAHLIRWFSQEWGEGRTWASHSAMVLRAGDKIEIIEALRKVVIRPISAYAVKKSRLLVCRKPGGLDEEQKEKLIEKAEYYHAKKYGVAKILAHALDRFFNNRYVFRRLARMDDYPICSWLVAYVYERVVGYKFGVEPNAAQPDDLLDDCVQKDWDFLWADSRETVADFCRVYGLESGDKNNGGSSAVNEQESGE